MCSLYKAYEVVREDVGGEKQIAGAGWAFQKDQGRFRHTANSYAALGDEARHGVQSEGTPSRLMSYPEAWDFIRKLIKRWLDERVVPRVGRTP